ncbi:MAG: hypothetical protein HKN49_00795 [Gammaproteobacteria bacterium]|nr:hypothetical protein [Gammaproteobacteria bacterium]
MKARAFTVLLASAFVFAGCASQTDTMSSSSSASSATSSSANASKIAEQQRKIAMLETELRNKERQVSTLTTNLDQARTSTTAAAPGSGNTSAVGDLFPPNPRPGECYARVIIPAQYKTTSKQVLKREASERIEIIPAKYEPSTERVLVKPASTRLVEVPAKYDMVTERVLDKPAHTVWKRATGKGAASGVAVASGGAAAMIERFGDQKVLETRVEDTGEVMCLVEVPATYKTVSKRVLVSPASVRQVEIPAEYKTVEVMKLARSAQERRIPIPAEYETVTLTEKITDEAIEWRPVLCEVNMTVQNVSSLQAALSKTGCCKCGPNRNECKVDGIIGPCTIEAARCYANQKGLPSGDKYITMEIIRSLGLKF